jgi:hypothetical protein
MGNPLSVLHERMQTRRHHAEPVSSALTDQSIE